MALLCSLAEAEAARGGGIERVLLVRWALRLPAEAEASLLRRWQANPNPNPNANTNPNLNPNPTLTQTLTLTLTLTLT